MYSHFFFFFLQIKLHIMRRILSTTLPCSQSVLQSKKNKNRKQQWGIDSWNQIPSIPEPGIEIGLDCKNVGIGQPYPKPFRLSSETYRFNCQPFNNHTGIHCHEQKPPLELFPQTTVKWSEWIMLVLYRPSSQRTKAVNSCFTDLDWRWQTNANAASHKVETSSTTLVSCILR